MNFSLFEVFLLTGIIQGFIIAIIIWLTKKRSISKMLLSVILIVFNLLCLKIMLFTTGLWQTAVFRYFPLPFDLAIQPLLYFYILSLTKAEFKFARNYLIHFLPFAISLVYSLLIYFSVLPQKQLIDKDLIANHFYFNQVKETEDILSVCSALLYWYGGLRHILHYRKWLYNNTSATDFPTYEWLRNIIILFGALFLMLFINILLDYSFGFGANNFFHWQILFTYLAILIYYLGFRGYHLPDKIFSTPAMRTIVPPGVQVQSTDKKTSEVKDAILKALKEDKIFLDPELNLQVLADRLKVSSILASSVINTELKKNFRNLVNEYRVEEIKLRLNDPQSARLSLLGIAYECGFNSEASFYRIFKNVVGLSPKEYLLRQQQL